jgi:hypothetical protein
MPSDGLRVGTGNARSGRASHVKGVAGRMARSYAGTLLLRTGSPAFHSFHFQTATMLELTSTICRFPHVNVARTSVDASQRPECRGNMLTPS